MLRFLFSLFTTGGEKSQVRSDQNDADSSADGCVDGNGRGESQVGE